MTVPSHRRWPLPVSRVPAALDAVGPSRDVHGARDHVLDRVAQLAASGALDAGNGDVMDAYLERLRQKWHAHHATRRSERVAAAEERLGGLESNAAQAQQRARAAADELRHTRRLLDEYERQFLEPVEKRPNDRPERRRRHRPTVDPLEGLVRPWLHTGLIAVLVLLAAAGDLVTFNLALEGTFRESGTEVLWTLTVAFAAASVGLMHGVGRALKNLRSARGGLGWPAIALMTGAWLALGAVASYFRLESTSTEVASTDSLFDADAVATAAAAEHEALLSAVLLAGLFLASGVLAFYAGYSEHHPQMTDYRALRRRLPKQQEQAASTAGAAITAQQALEHARSEKYRAERSLHDSIAAADAEIAELRELVRVEVAGHLGMPAATNGLTTGRLDDEGAPSAGSDEDGDAPAVVHVPPVPPVPPVVPSPRAEASVDARVDQSGLWGTPRG